MEPGYAIHHPKTYTYRGIVAKENPWTGDWLVCLGPEYGDYFSVDKSAVRELVDNMFKHKKENK